MTDSCRALLLLPAVLPFVSYDLDARKQNASPNVLLIVSDDHGYGDFGFNGNPLISTPNLDRLAGESARYDNFLVCPASSPTRASLYTGRFYLETGVWVVPPRANLRDDETVMPTFFQKAGYKTMLSGKGDSSTPVGHPREEYWHDFYGGCTPYQNMTETISSNPEISSIRKQLEFESGGYVKYNPEEGFHSELITDEAEKFIRENRNRKWMLSLNFIAPHLPWVCDRRFSDPYLEKGLPQRVATCWGEVSQMDHCIGRVLDLLDDLGLSDDTIVIFLSDNGPTNELQDRIRNHDGFNAIGEEWAYRNNMGLRGYKALAFENGIRVPLLVRWPGKVEAGLRHQLVGVEDILPTMMELISFNPDKVDHLPFTGVGFSNTLFDADAPSSRKPIFRVDLAYGGNPKTEGGIVPDPAHIPFDQVHTVMRGQRYKFHSFQDGTQALYDLDADPQERTDVAANHPEIVAELEASCRARWTELLGTGRAYYMPDLTIGKIPYGQTFFKAVSCNPCHARKFTGRTGIFGQTVQGFAEANSSALYHLDIRQSGNYRVVLIGKDMDKCQPLYLRVGSMVFYPSSVTPKQIVFNGVALDDSDETLLIKAEGEEGDAYGRCALRFINFVNLDVRN